MQITELACLWYGCFRSRTVRVILVRDDKPRTRDRDDRVYGLPLVTTDLDSAAEDLVGLTRRGGELSRRSPSLARSSVWVRPAIGHVAPWYGPCRSG